jgi:hypothetical protein
MKLLKLLMVLVLAVLVLLVVAGVVAFSMIDKAARVGIEKGGTYALGVQTTLKEANVGVFGGTFAMSGLRVANAQGFPGPHFLTLGDASVAVSLGTLSKPTVELPHLTLDTIDVRLEKKDGKTNYNAILDNLKKVSGDGGESKPAPQPEGEGKKFVINDLSIRKVTVHVDLLGGPDALGALTKVTIPIDEVKLQNVGKTGTGVGGTGVTMGQLTGIIVQAVLAAAVEKGQGLIPGDILGDLSGQLASLGDLSKLDLKVLGDAKGTVEEVGKKVEEAAKDAAKKAEDAVKDATKAIQGLIPGQKKDGK